MKKSILVVGGAGFIGSHVAKRALQRGRRVVILDAFLRPGVQKNLDWLKTYGSFKMFKGDVRNKDSVRAAFRKAAPIETVAHLAGQVAVTTSVANPYDDFLSNALGTLQILEAARAQKKPPVVLFSSTNKVYGGFEALGIKEMKTCYGFRNFPHGIPETWPLDFHSPYGCSKGAADQYVRDYARIYGLKTVVFRQSCIYGTQQFGVEDQGWISWFIIATLLGKPLTIFGNGKQVRDVLYVDDLVDAYETAEKKITRARGNIYNTGGGPQNTLSLRELVAWLENRLGRRLNIKRGPWRPGDQRVYISDIRRLQQDLGWRPKVTVHQGLENIFNWVSSHRQLFR